MKIEHGKTYVTNNGTIVGPMVNPIPELDLMHSNMTGDDVAFVAANMRGDYEGIYENSEISGKGGSYSIDGIWLTSDRDDPLSIIEEYNHDLPIREVVRTEYELVPGIYGRLFVNGAGHVGFVNKGTKDWTSLQGYKLSKEELLEAANVLQNLAQAKDV